MSSINGELYCTQTFGARLIHPFVNVYVIVANISTYIATLVPFWASAKISKYWLETALVKDKLYFMTDVMSNKHLAYDLSICQ